MSHQNSGPRDYVHKDFHNEVVEELNNRIEALGQEWASRDEHSSLQASLIEQKRKVTDLQAQLERANAQNTELAEHRDKTQADAQARYRALEEATNGEAWAWVGDGSDDLGSMSDDMVVAIGAGRLRGELRRAGLKRPMVVTTLVNGSPQQHRRTRDGYDPPLPEGHELADLIDDCDEVDDWPEG